MPTLPKSFYDIEKAVQNFDKLTARADSVFRKFVSDIFQDILERSPVDKGFYRNDWEMKQVSAPGVISAVRIVNNMPYAGVLEHGSPVGGKPWASAGPKTTEINGRIWSNQMPEPVAEGAVESAHFKELYNEIFKIVSRGLVYGKA